MVECLASLLPRPEYGVLEVLRPYAWVPVVSFAASFLATPMVRALARRLRVVDKPDGFLKPHGRPIAYLGGVAVYLGWLAGLLLPLPGPGLAGWRIGLGLAGALVVGVGLADDILEIRPSVKILGQLAAGVILLAFGVGQRISLIGLTLIWPERLVPEWLTIGLSVPISLVLVVAASNAMNLLDGLDGLCSGVTGIVSVMFLVLATHLAMYGYSEQGDPVRLAAALAMVGAVCGFLPYNLPPATIFLGDAGSMLLGLFAAAMMLMFAERPIARWVLAAMMIFALPILDTFLALLRRRRLGRPIFAGDRSHLYDQLVDRGYTVRQTVAISYGLSVFYGLVGVGIILIRTRYAAPICLVVAAVTLYLCYRWGFLREPVATEREQGLPGRRARDEPEDAPRDS